jgi:CRP/FNR family transcriptional regulator, cyclic AMP receptor protein
VTASDFWAALTEAEREAFGQRSAVRRWARGEVLFHQGDDSDWVALIQSGRVKASSHTAGGAEVVLAVRGPGALLGELSAVDREPRSATLQALEPVQALVMALAEFEAFLLGHARVAYLLMRMLSERLRDADRKRIEFGAQDTTGRVAARLVELAERFGESTPDGAIRISLPLSQDELAGWVGSSREAVSKALGVLRNAGEIRTSRLSMAILDLAALQKRSD